MTTTVDETGRRVEETPLLVTSQVGDEVVPPKAERGDTAYVILQAVAGEVDAAWKVASENTQARSAEAAVRAYAEGMKADMLDASGVTLVAIPVRSWKPTRIKPQTVTTLVIEEA